jgi:hypothetical protein
MTLTRRGIADEFDRLDHEVEEANFDKRAILAGYRKQLEATGTPRPQIKIEVEALKAAIRQRRALARDPDGVAATSATVEAILAEISGPSRGARAHARAMSVPKPETSPNPPPPSPQSTVSDARPDKQPVTGDDPLDIPPQFDRRPKQKPNPETQPQAP